MGPAFRKKLMPGKISLSEYFLNNFLAGNTSFFQHLGDCRDQHFIDGRIPALFEIATNHKPVTLALIPATERSDIVYLV
jgi:hypothetical protein